MGCDFTIHIGKLPIKGWKHDFVSLILGQVVDIDENEAIKQPHIIVGECSFLKAGLTEDDSYIPEPIRVLSDIIPYYGTGKTKKIDEFIKLVEEIKWENSTSYELYISKKELIEFLRKHEGEECYYVCW